MAQSSASHKPVPQLEQLVNLGPLNAERQCYGSCVLYPSGHQPPIVPGGMQGELEGSQMAAASFYREEKTRQLRGEFLDHYRRQ